MKLYIRAEDLNKDNYNNNWKCPIAKALKRKFKRSFIVGFRASYTPTFIKKYTWTKDDDDKVEHATRSTNKRGFHINIRKLYLAKH